MTHGEIIYRTGHNTAATRQELINALTSAERYGGYEVAWFDADAQEVPFGFDVDLYAPDRAYHSPEGEQWYTKPAEVNWGSLGSKTPEQARIYGELLIEAARIAEAVNSGLKIVTQKESYAYYEQHRAEVTAQHATHIPGKMQDCDECGKIRGAERQAQEMANAAAAKLHQKTADRLYKQARSLDWQIGTYEQREEARKIGECQKTDYRRGHGHGKHVMNANGQCINCSQAIDTLVAAFAVRQAAIAATGKVVAS
jgi:hypothetical protein